MTKLIQALIIIGMSLSISAMVHGNDYITIKAHINGQPVLLAFDTGADGAAVFRKTARRLKLEVQYPPTDFRPQPGKVKLGITKKYPLEFGEVEWQLNFGVVDLSDFVKIELDGVIGWGTISQNIIEISYAPNKLKFHDQLVRELKQKRVLLREVLMQS